MSDHKFLDEIVSMTRDETKNSKSKMWRCWTASNERVNVFEHADPEKNSFVHFLTAGYGPDLYGMVLGQVLEWSQYPIRVYLCKPGDARFWDIESVVPKPAGARPDAIKNPSW